MASKKKKSSAKTKVAKALPGASRLNKRMAREAIQKINLYIGLSNLRAALDIGQYILDTFFDGDVSKYEDRHDAHATYQEMVNPEDDSDLERLEVSDAWIKHAIRVAAQYPLLPEDVRDQLPLSHHKILEPLEDADKVKLATRAAEGGWSKRKLEEEKNKLRGKVEGRTGRPPVPGLVKGLDRLDSIAKLITEKIDWSDPFPGYSDKKAREHKSKTKRRLDSAEKKLTKMLEAVRAARENL